MPACGQALSSVSKKESQRRDRVSFFICLQRPPKRCFLLAGQVTWNPSRIRREETSSGSIKIRNRCQGHMFYRHTGQSPKFAAIAVGASYRPEISGKPGQRLSHAETEDETRIQTGQE